MNELNCEFVRDVYPDMLDGTADAPTSDAVRAHLVSCAECRAEAEAVTAIFAGALIAPPSLHARVMTEYRASVAQPTRFGFGIRQVAVAATVAAAVIGGSVLFRSSNEQVQPTAVAEAPIGAVTVEAAFVSGTESLQDLTVEELEQLLGEIDS
jgi:hypothetical protein